MPQKVSHITPAFQSFMWDGVSAFPTAMVKTGGPCGILLFPRAAAGGCYVGAPPCHRCAKYDRYGEFPFRSLPRCMRHGRCNMHESFPLLISRARKRPIASTGRQGNCHSACRVSTECEAAQLRNAVSQTDTHSDAAGASKASGKAEMCGPVSPAISG